MHMTGLRTEPMPHPTHGMAYHSALCPVPATCRSHLPSTSHYCATHARHTHALMLAAHQIPIPACKCHTPQPLIPPSTRTPTQIPSVHTPHASPSHPTPHTPPTAPFTFWPVAICTSQHAAILCNRLKPHTHPTTSRTHTKHQKYTIKNRKPSKP